MDRLVILFAVLMTALPDTGAAQGTLRDSATRAMLLVREIGGADTPHLDSVNLGMTLAELRRARPTARAMDYSGWVEDIAGGPIDCARITARAADLP